VTVRKLLRNVKKTSKLWDGEPSTGITKVDSEETPTMPSKALTAPVTITFDAPTAPPVTAPLPQRAGTAPLPPRAVPPRSVQPMMGTGTADLQQVPNASYGSTGGAKEPLDKPVLGLVKSASEGS